MAKKEKILEKITIPEDVTVKMENKIITIKGEKGEISKTFSHPKIDIKINNNVIEINCKNVRRKEEAIIGTFVAHIKNMIKGVKTGFEYKMKTVFSHFPIKTSVDKNNFVIENFLGERSARKAKILDGINVEIKGDIISVKGVDKDRVGQTVANIERASKVKKRDVRIFQDGIYRINKGD